VISINRASPALWSESALTGSGKWKGQGALSTTECGARFDETISSKIQELLEESEREGLAPQSADTASDSPLSQRSERIVKPAPERTSMGEELNGTLKLAAGERKIPTALAQYPQGRSKVQVAVSPGYGAAGGGLNNYLGALRSCGLIEGAGDRITITEIMEFRRLVRGIRCQLVPH
jgi:hypothetical protein